jgi:hypothetical protein
MLVYACRTPHEKNASCAGNRTGLWRGWRFDLSGMWETVSAFSS